MGAVRKTEGGASMLPAFVGYFYMA